MHVLPTRHVSSQNHGQDVKLSLGVYTCVDDAHTLATHMDAWSYSQLDAWSYSQLDAWSYSQLDVWVDRRNGYSSRRGAAGIVLCAHLQLHQVAGER